jgi:nucleoside-diphosphate-sugar epimerase
MKLQGKRIVITGATGQVGLPVAKALAQTNEVWAAARFSNAAARNELEAAGVKCAVIDLATGDLAAIPDDVDACIHLAVSRSGDFDVDLTDNAEATGLLMQRCQNAGAFLYCSSTAVYEPKDHDAINERDPLGDNHRVMFPTYSIVKIATEAVARTCARLYNLPTVITRLNVPYGDNGGWPYFHVLMMQGGMDIPVHTNGPSVYNPIHEQDIIGAIPSLLGAASVPATIVNLAGDEEVSIEDWCAYLGDLTGLQPKIAPTDNTLESVATDNTKLRELGWKQTVTWRDGLRRMVESKFPDLLQG